MNVEFLDNSNLGPYCMFRVLKDGIAYKILISQNRLGEILLDYLDCCNKEVNNIISEVLEKMKLKLKEELSFVLSKSVVDDLFRNR